MRHLLFALALLFVTPAHAQDQANVVVSCGSVTLKAGTSSFRTIDLTGQTCNSGGGGGTTPTSVWSATDATAGGMTLTNGGLTVTVIPASLVNQFQILRNTISKTSGKVYIEVAFTSLPSSQPFHIGVASTGVNINSYLGASNYSLGANTTSGSVFVSTGFTQIGASINDPIAVNDVLMFAIDFNSNFIWIGKNNVWYDSGAPATATNPLASFVPATVGPLFFAMAFYNGNTATMALTLQPTAASQKYAPPAGFVAWDSAP